MYCSVPFDSRVVTATREVHVAMGGGAKQTTFPIGRASCPANTFNVEYYLVIYLAIVLKTKSTFQRKQYLY